MGVGLFACRLVLAIILISKNKIKNKSTEPVGLELSVKDTWYHRQTQGMPRQGQLVMECHTEQWNSRNVNDAKMKGVKKNVAMATGIKNEMRWFCNQQLLLGIHNGTFYWQSQGWHGLMKTIWNIIWPRFVRRRIAMFR